MSIINITDERQREVIKKGISSLFPNTLSGMRSPTRMASGRLSITRYGSREHVLHLTSVATKGLGTSTNQDAKDYFSNMTTHMIPFAPLKTEDRPLIDMAFSKQKVEERKEWLRKFKVHLPPLIRMIDLISFGSLERT